ncbi:hypothetical protein RND71_042569 [Anisodus tanguticus]|uniref:Uncharacterized protein n=1 Tax=Anisodus tanguticus TaxID=243964 RepID=A0AAE1QTN6_9SOLA|nr:hypothetical protein RND71_042569 [Anisodus tanguticus]
MHLVRNKRGSKKQTSFEEVQVKKILNNVKYGLSSMQGWRATMEDAHAAIPDLDASMMVMEMMRGQRGWRELAALGDKLNKFTGMIEGIIWSPKNGDGNNHVDDWAFEYLLCLRILS